PKVSGVLPGLQAQTAPVDLDQIEGAQMNVASAATPQATCNHLCNHLNEIRHLTPLLVREKGCASLGKENHLHDVAAFCGTIFNCALNSAAFLLFDFVL